MFSLPVYPWYNLKSFTNVISSNIVYIFKSVENFYFPNDNCFKTQKKGNEIKSSTSRKQAEKSHYQDKEDR